jgi:phosphatidylglycerol:prolipoprotein diacylglycerol transferase
MKIIPSPFELSSLSIEVSIYHRIGATKILWHVVLETLGLFTGFRYFLYIRKKQKDSIPDSNRIWILKLIGAIFGQCLGAGLSEDWKTLTK